MARTDQQGFEQRAISLLDGYAAVADAVVEINTTAAYDSIGYGLQISSGAAASSLAWARFMSPDVAQSDQAYMRGMMKIDLNGNSSRFDAWFDLLDDEQNPIIRFYPATAEYELPIAAPSVYYALSPGVITANWMRWEFFVKVADSGGMVLIRQDGVDVKYIYTDTKRGTASKLGGLYWFAGAEKEISYYVDDLAYNDTVDAGRGNITYPGVGKIIGRRANGPGSNTDYAPSPGTGEANWSDVDDGVPDDDTTYVASGSIGDIDTYSVANLPDGYTVREGCVKMTLRAKLAAPGSEEVATYVVDGASAVQGASVTPNAYSYRNYHEMIPVAPDTSEWTKASVDSAEFGFKSSA